MDKRVQEFIGYARREHNLTIVSENGLVVHPIAGWSGKDRVDLAIIINDRSTIESIRDSWWYIVKWREALRDFQPEHHRDWFCERLASFKDDGLSYAEIAERINQRLAELLSEYQAFLDEFNAVKAEFETMGDFFLWYSMHNEFPFAHAFSFEHADRLLSDCQPRLPKDEREQILMATVEEIGVGASPTIGDGVPVHGDDIRARLRYWQQSQGVEKTG